MRDLPADPVTDNVPRQVSGASYTRVAPTPVAAPRLLAWSDDLGERLGIGRADAAMVEVLAGNRVLPGMQPYAARYGGHQFGHWAGQLGDGRAITLGEVDRARRHAPGAAAEGRRPHALLAHRRRPRGAALVAARVRLQRGDALARRADHARALAWSAPARA